MLSHFSDMPPGEAPARVAFSLAPIRRADKVVTRIRADIPDPHFVKCPER